MISPDIIKLSSEEFMALVEKCEAEAVKEYKNQAPEMRDSYIQFWVPVNEKQCRKCLSMGLRTSTSKMVGDKLTSRLLKTESLL